MSTITIDPFPRLDDTQVDWSEWSFLHGGEPSPASDITENWDPYSTLSVLIRVTVNDLDPEMMRAPSGVSPALKLTAACQETANTFVSHRVLSKQGSQFTAEVELEIDTKRIEGQLDIRAVVVLPVADAKGHEVPWLKHRIIAECRKFSLDLSTEDRGFPSSATSFKREGWYPAPWRFDITCSELSDSFSNSIRLYMNKDDKTVVDLINGKNTRNRRGELEGSIHRVLLLTAQKLSEEIIDRPDQVAEEFPESIAAAARQSAVSFLGLESLSEALELIRRNPEELDYLIMAQTSGA